MSKVTVIAEIGSNWRPDARHESLAAMIRLAGEVGADVAKLQDFRPIKVLDRPQEWKDSSRPWQLPDNWPETLTPVARDLGVDLIASVFTYYAVIRTQGMSAIKIASSEIANQDLLLAVNRWHRGDTGYLSVPHDRQGAVISALVWLRNCRLTLLHCVAEYPANHVRMTHLTELAGFGLPVGFSSHVPYPQVLDVVREAVERGAVVVEMHLRSTETPKNAPDNGDWSLYPEQFREAVEVIRGG